MDAVEVIAALWVSSLAVSSGAPPVDCVQTPEPVEAVRRLSGEFQSQERSALEAARNASTAAEREEANRARPDRRKYARRFLALASATTDDATAVDALVWVVQHGVRTPEGDEAVQKIGDGYCRSDRIALACHALGARGPQGEGLLKRIFDENPSPGVRGRACLALAFAGSLRLRRESQSEGNLPQNRPEEVRARQRALQERASRSASLAAEIERWLGHVLYEFPGVLIAQDVTENLGMLAENLGPTAGEILRRIAETHPQQEVRWDAECGLAIQQMQIASLVADLRSVAAEPPGSKKCAGPALAAACVFGGATRLSGLDSKALVREIEQRLQKITDRANDLTEPGICYFHLIMDSPTLAQYHAGTEALLRRVANDHPDQRRRTAARRSLAIYLAGIADLSRTIDSNRALWVDRLGEDRVDQIRHFKPDQLMHDARALAEEVSIEYGKAGKVADAKIDAIRNSR